MPPAEQARLGSGCATLGADTVLGPRFWSVQQRFRLRTEPLDYPAFAALLPDGPLHAPLRAAVTSVMGLARVWELNPVLRGDAVPPLRLDGARRLGWDSWCAMSGHECRERTDVSLTISYG
jgi:type VI secretion system protein ImpH